MHRLTAAQLASGTLTVVVATTLGLAGTGASALPAVLGIVLLGLALGVAVSVGIGRTQRAPRRAAQEAVRPAAPLVADFLPVAPLASVPSRERQHSYSA